jgi:hypothetical protein
MGSVSGCVLIIIIIGSMIDTYEKKYINETAYLGIKVGRMAATRV